LLEFRCQPPRFYFLRPLRARPPSYCSTCGSLGGPFSCLCARILPLCSPQLENCFFLRRLPLAVAFRCTARFGSVFSFFFSAAPHASPSLLFFPLFTNPSRSVVPFATPPLAFSELAPNVEFLCWLGSYREDKRSISFLGPSPRVASPCFSFLGLFLPCNSQEGPEELPPRNQILPVLFDRSFGVWSPIARPPNFVVIFSLPDVFFSLFVGPFVCRVGPHSPQRPLPAALR